MKKFNLLILAAGRGKRLGNKTNKMPKPLMKYKKKYLLDYQLEIYKKYKNMNIYMVLGYQSKKIQNYLIKKKIKIFLNSKYKDTNMFFSFLFAKSLLNQKKDLIVVYGDIIFKPKIFSKLIKDKHNLSISVDKNYLSYWKKRMKNPLKDLETMIIKNKFVVQLGKKTSSYSEIQGQYMGLVKFSFKKFNKIKKIIKDIQTSHRQYKKFYFTDFLQLLINNNIKARAVETKGYWQEFDKPKDFKIDNLN
tara:strand:- start:1292 stop:2035 length:744 start_codon:yes stop_codon:yes gene_type:complete